ncbi:MAG: quinolinate synthase NadA [Bdellovibrionales bacterium]|nr:quinolinate synthase NadA [Bdellovibrionales bacterium]
MRTGEDLFEKLARLKRERNAVVLAHYYQNPDIQDAADFIGDSLQLSQQAAKTTADVILFAGVHFMAETAKILNPARKVIIPDPEASCSLADGCPAPLFREFKRRHPDHVVVSYINCSAEVKAESDFICTSSNAVRIVGSIPMDRPILFAPDKNLGRWVMRQTGREMALWEGSCIVHETFSERKLLELKTRHPEAEVVAHPECEEPVLRLADFIGSTTALLKYTQNSPKREFIVVTEPGILHQMQKANPGKAYIPAPPDANCACNECPYMKRNTLEKVVRALETLSPEITISEDLRGRALAPIERMLTLS